MKVLRESELTELVTSSKAKVELNMQILLVSSKGLHSVSTADTDKNLSRLHLLKERGRNLVEERQITHLESHH